MKKSNLFVLILFLVIGMLASCSKQKDKAPAAENQPVKQLAKKAQTQHYPFECGIIYQKSDVMGILSSPVVYFDKWGEWETTETTTSIEIMGIKQSNTSLTIMKGVDHWDIDINNKTGRHYSLKAMKSAVGVDLENVSKEFLGKMNIEELGEETYLGYKCKKYRLKSDKGMSVEYLMYGNLMMKMSGEAMGVPTKTEVVKIEKVKPPVEKFEIPKGIAITEE